MNFEERLWKRATSRPRQCAHPQLDQWLFPRAPVSPSNQNVNLTQFNQLALILKSKLSALLGYNTAKKKTKGYEFLEAPVLQILELQIGWNIGDLARTSEYETPKLKFMTAAEANHAAFAFLLCFFLGDMQGGNVHSVGYIAYS